MFSIGQRINAMPGDGPSTALLRRVEGLKANPPSSDWDGSWHIENSSQRRSLGWHKAADQRDIAAYDAGLSDRRGHGSCFIGSHLF